MSVYVALIPVGFFAGCLLVALAEAFGHQRAAWRARRAPRAHQTNRRRIVLTRPGRRTMYLP